MGRAPLAGPSLCVLFLPGWLEWNASLEVNTLGRVGCLGREKTVRKQVFSREVSHALIHAAVLLRNTRPGWAGCRWSPLALRDRM